MKEIPLEKRLERYDAISQALRDALNSDEITHMFWAIGEAHHLGEERTFKVVKIVGYIMMGFIHPQDLQREIVSETTIDKRLAEEIAHELQVKILNPLIPEINATFNYHITGVPAPSSTAIAPSFAPQPEIMRPAFAPGGQETRSSKQGLEVNRDRPFILHEEQKETESVRPADETLVRPSFYEEMGNGKQEAVGRPMAARLEIGGEQSRAASSGRVTEREPQIGRTEESPIRVVHYSGPQTLVDPFGDQRPETRDQPLEAAEQKTEPPKDIHPENIVDLKDLPK